MEDKRYIVSGRIGTKLTAAVMLRTKTEAEEYIESKIAACVVESFRQALKDDHVDTKDNHAIVEWGEAHCYCTAYNCGMSVIDTYRYGNDWSEYIITEVVL